MENHPDLFLRSHLIWYVVHLDLFLRSHLTWMVCRLCRSLDQSDVDHLSSFHLKDTSISLYI